MIALMGRILGLMVATWLAGTSLARAQSRTVGVELAGRNGSLPPSAVAEVFAAQAEELQACVGFASDARPSVELAVVIEAEGAVREIQGQGEQSELRDCFETKVNRLRFPRQDGPTTLVLRFTVAPGAAVFSAAAPETAASPAVPPPPAGGEGGASGFQVRGHLPSEVVRRVIRRHTAQVRYCYERELVRNPAIEGRVIVRFIIGTTGTVQTALVASSTLGNASVEQCIRRQVRRWRFPAPESGIVVVTMPFVLSSR